MPAYDWRLWKAQLYQESLLNPDAVSPVGARGLAQFMPGTWAEVSRQLGYEHLNPHMAEPAIIAGAYYMARQLAIWKAPRPAADRYSLAAASYNAGAGNIIKAQQVCGGSNGYAEIISCLPEVTGHHSKETKTYVQRIWRYWTEMLLGVRR
jgi:membrane-bound lytic murein transglycosylase F